MGTETTNVQMILSLNDKATEQLVKFNRTLGGIGATATEVHKKMEDGSKKSGAALISLNQGLELAAKSFALIKFAIEAPLKQFNALFEVSEKLVRKYDEQFLAETKLTQAAKSSGNASSESVRKFEQLAEQLEKTTRFQADAIVSGQAMALSMGATARIIPQVTQAALDLAAATGGDASSGFEKLIQAVETGNLRTFGRAHIEFQRTGNAVLDFATASELAESKFRGLAQEVAKGGAGQLITVENAFDQIEKSLGKIIANSPQFQGFLKTVTDVFNEISKFIDEHGAEIGNLFGSAFAASVDIAVKALGLFIGALKLAGSLIFNMLEAMSHVPGLGVESPFEDINKQIRAIEDRLASQRPHVGLLEFAFGGVDAERDAFLVEEAGKKIDALKEKKKELLKDPFQGVGLGASLDVLQTSAKKLSDEISKNPLFTAEGFKERFAKNTAEAAASIDELKNHVDTFAEKAHSNFDDVLLQLQEFAKANRDASGSVKFLAEIIEGSAAKGTDQFEAVGRALQILLKFGDINEEQFGQLVHTMTSGFSDAEREIQKADSALKKLQSDARAGVSTSVGVTTTTTGGTSSGGGEGATKVAGAVGGNPLEQAARAMSEAVVAAAASLSAAAGDFSDPIKGLADAGAAIALQAKAATDAADALSGTADGLNQASFGLLSASGIFADTTKQGANDLISAANDLVTASGFLDKTFRQGSFPHLGFGGVPTGDTLAHVGDRPEVILPLDDRGLAFARSLLGSKGGGGAGDIHVAINVDRLDLSDASMNEVARVVERRLADRVLESVRRGG